MKPTGRLAWLNPGSRRVVAIPVLLFGAGSVHAAPVAGGVDLSFDPGSGVNGTVKAIAVQPDGKLVLAGQFTTVQGLLRPHLARLNADGTGDATFHAGAVADAHVSAVLVQPDGKVLFTRDFFNLTGALPGAKVARLNSDGSPDPGFTPVLGEFPHGGGITCVALQPDGKVVLGGYSNDYFVDEESVVHYFRKSLLVRLHPDGSQDDGFSNADGSLGSVFGGAPPSSIAVQADGKLVIGGQYLIYELGGQTYYGTARLDPDGSLDSGFRPAVDGYVQVVAALAGGRTLLAGHSIGSGDDRHALAMLNPDGSRDETFDRSAGGLFGVHALVVSPDAGTILLSGSAWDGDDAPRTRIVRLHTGGEVDGSFNSGTGPERPDNSATVLALQHDGEVVVAGAFTTFQGNPRQRVARLGADGLLDEAFDPGSGLDGGVGKIALLPDGKVLAGGGYLGTTHYSPGFTAVQGALRNHLARLQANGRRDDGFDPGTGLTDPVWPIDVSSLVTEPSGRVLVAGTFSAADGTPRYQIARWEADGTVDGGFDPGAGEAQFFPRALALQPDGKILVGGRFATLDGLLRNGAARILADGGIDAAFDPEIAGAPGSYHTEVHSLVVQPDGKVLVAGFSVHQSPAPQWVSDFYAAFLLRLHADGRLDEAFTRTDPTGDPWAGYTAISAVALQADGKVLIGGYFSEVQGTPRSGVARLNADGTVDATFDPGAGVGEAPPRYPVVMALAVQADGRVLIGGEFSTVGGTARNNIARLNPDGSLDTGFDPGAGTDRPVISVAVQPDGRVLISGDFTTVDGAVRPHLARLLGDPVRASLSIALAGETAVLSWPETTTPVELQESRDLSLPGSWTTVVERPAAVAGRMSVRVPMGGRHGYYRLVSPPPGR